ncbi:glutamate-5-semialdehyde dehydrogenase [Alkalicoccus daliensis]|uniref:Gamma-glutamyl phosphate reductase n=1 Tax=Alkalicoccus daliensis TaxID=745820 RepID=A0A1H0AJB8_9BACI|nr:glutamate-5-semialdehyde dehydrogenase [Alkalicoccus daliensis]SDN33455.1 glutamate-5-semialdehyde dehydrogenase [Alkalicoccus daliensis]
MDEVIQKAKTAKEISYSLSDFDAGDRKKALISIADALRENVEEILAANKKDVKKSREKGVSSALIDRLHLDHSRLEDISQAVINVAELPDHLGEVKQKFTPPNELTIRETIVPLGVVSVIYEARPNVTVDITSLALKTGNAVLLRGSSSTIESNKVLVSIMQTALEKTGFPRNSVQLIESPDRTLTKSLFTAKQYIDVLIPRGGKDLIDTVVREAQIPVIETGAGNCHIYIDEHAAPELARRIIIDAKVQRPSVCNSCETILLHKKWAEANFADLLDDLSFHGVQLHGDSEAAAYSNIIQKADESDWEKEYLSLDLAVKVVASAEEAIEHIQQYSTMHSEAVITEDAKVKDIFFKKVDASTVYHNASTRFTDGFEFGFGAEVGISTQKLHARGPMGLQALTSTKYLVSGTGQTKGNLPLSGNIQK